MRASILALAAVASASAAVPTLTDFISSGVSSSASSEVVDFEAVLARAGIQRVENDAAAPPPQPSWPMEWSTVLYQTNTTANKTIVADYAFSWEHNSTVFSPETTDYTLDTYNYYWMGTAYTVSGVNGQPLVCSEQRLSGSPGYPPVQFFAYNGTVNVNGQTCWMFRLDASAYVTERTKQQNPVALIDGANNIITFFTGFESYLPPATWPPGYFMIPEPCATTA
jgi:hypothetical protein